MNIEIVRYEWNSSSDGAKHLDFVSACRAFRIAGIGVSLNEGTTKEDDVEEAKRVIQATAMMIGKRPSIFGCPSWWVLGRKTKLLFSVMGIGFLALSSTQQILTNPNETNMV